MDGVILAFQYGCGPIGCRIIQQCVENPHIELVGAVDIDTSIVGTDIGEIAHLGEDTGVVVTDDFSRLIEEQGPQIAIHATGSNLDVVADQILKLIESGVNVVSTCEELSYPYRRHPGISSKLDKAAKEHGVTVLATGINPGFLMDAWPVFMTGVCREVRTVEVTRIQNASTRRLPFQRKIGAGLSPEEFATEVEAGNFGHVGLSESIWMISDALGLSIQSIREEIGPVVLDKEVSSTDIVVPPGRVAGLKQTAVGNRDGLAVVSMDFQAYLGAPEAYDAVHIHGIPELEVKIHGGVHGDIGTVSIILNAVERVVDAPSGLLTMLDMPAIHCRGRQRSYRAINSVP